MQHKGINQDWWRGAVIYQIYPRSFCDSNADGVGDLPGIIKKLPYIANLGIDAIWISPFLKSPQADYGYDVSDYYAVDPLFGTLEDLEQLITQAHALNIRVLMDLVLNHTSIEHAWFQESRQNETNPKANWYVWADAKPDGSPPNNWLSVFGGSAWAWDEVRQQYYLHNFLAQQPDLNFHQPDVLTAMLGVMRFWLDRGIDGFRLDAVNYYVHDTQLRDNTLRKEGEPGASGVPANNPYARQYHLFDKTQEENYLVLERIRHLLNQYPGAIAIGEVGDDHSLLTSARYTAGERYLHTVYTFHLLDVSDQFSATLMQETIAEVERYMHESWPCWALSNHDVPRVATRFAKGKSSLALSKVLMAMLLSLRGTVCLYQGEELGLEEADVPYEKMRDPYGLAFYPEFKGRDGCRTPMPWNDKDGGFSSGEPWLPLSSEHLNYAVSVQEGSANSMLNFTRHFLRWRKNFPALTQGKITLVSCEQKDLLVFKRSREDEIILVALNLSDQSQQLMLQDTNYEILQGHGLDSNYENGVATLASFSAIYLKVIHA
jgi:alpha-glucosidase